MYNNLKDEFSNIFIKSIPKNPNILILYNRRNGIIVNLTIYSLGDSNDLSYLTIEVDKLEGKSIDDFFGQSIKNKIKRILSYNSNNIKIL